MSEVRVVRIAMWSGPRNISTAMMRAWGNRSDTAVIDEPFYACYLKMTGKKHPGADEVIAAGETDWRKVVNRLIGPAPEGKRGAGRPRLCPAGRDIRFRFCPHKQRSPGDRCERCVAQS